MVLISNPYSRKNCKIFIKLWLTRCSLLCPSVTFLSSYKSKSLDLLSGHHVFALLKGLLYTMYAVATVNVVLSVRKSDLEKPGHLPKCLSYGGPQLGMQTRALCLQGPPLEPSLLPCVSDLGADSLPLG